MSERKTICIFGDSISWGANDPDGLGWSNRLRRYLEMNRFNVKCYDSSISGANSSHLVERFPIEAKARKPQKLIFAIGINDSQYIGKPLNFAVSLDQFRKNLSALYNEGKKHTHDISFVGLTKVDEARTKPCFWNTAKFYENENVLLYDAEIRRFCMQNSLPYIPMFDLLDAGDLDDGLHPNSQGHAKLFSKVKDTLLSAKDIAKLDDA